MLLQIVIMTVRILIIADIYADAATPASGKVLLLKTICSLYDCQVVIFLMYAGLLATE